MLFLSKMDYQIKYLSITYFYMICHLLKLLGHRHFDHRNGFYNHQYIYAFYI